MRELYQYARVDGAHVLELVVKAALTSVKDRQIQKVADVYILSNLAIRLSVNLNLKFKRARSLVWDQIRFGMWDLI